MMTQSDLWSSEHHYYSISGITVLCHFRKNYLMPVLICKNDRYPDIISSINTKEQQCVTEMKYIGKPICLIKLIHKLLFL